MTWSEHRLGRIARLRVSNVDKLSRDDELPVRLCNYVDVYRNGSITSDLDFMQATASASQIANFRLSVGDTVFTKDSETADDIGIPAYVAESESDLVCGYHLAIATPNPDQVHPRYLYWAMASAFVREQWTVLAAGVTRVGLRSDDMAKAAVPLPPLDEQRRIADFLDAETERTDALTAQRAQQAARMRERRASLLLALVGGASRGRLVASGLEWLPSLPEAWPVAKLTLLARLGSGHTPSRSKPEWWADPSVPWITTGEVAQMRSDRLETLYETRELLSPHGIENSSAEIHPRGTVVLSRTASVGYSAVMGREMATSQDFATWTCGRRLDPYFLLWALRAMRPWLLGARAMGSTHKTIYMPDLQSLRIPVPPLEAQNAIVTAIRTSMAQIDQVTDVLHTQSSLLAERRQALITAAVTGELDVTTAGRRARPVS